MSDISANVWVNGSTKVLSYLTLIGNYVADTPLILPSQFMLVLLNGASLIAPWNFTAVADHTALSAAPGGNALVVITSRQMTGVISPSGDGVLSCLNIPPSYYTTNTILGLAPTGNQVNSGPDGIVSQSSTNVIFDGLNSVHN